MSEAGEGGTTVSNLLLSGPGLQSASLFAAIVLDQPAGEVGNSRAFVLSCQNHLPNALVEMQQILAYDVQPPVTSRSSHSQSPLFALRPMRERRQLLARSMAISDAGENAP